MSMTDTEVETEEAEPRTMGAIQADYAGVAPPKGREPRSVAHLADRLERGIAAKQRKVDRATDKEIKLATRLSRWGWVPRVGDEIRAAHQAAQARRKKLEQELQRLQEAVQLVKQREARRREWLAQNRQSQEQRTRIVREAKARQQELGRREAERLGDQAPESPGERWAWERRLGEEAAAEEAALGGADIFAHREAQAAYRDAKAHWTEGPEHEESRFEAHEEAEAETPEEEMEPEMEMEEPAMEADAGMGMGY